MIFISLILSSLLSFSAQKETRGEHYEPLGAKALHSFRLRCLVPSNVLLKLPIQSWNSRSKQWLKLLSERGSKIDVELVGKSNTLALVITKLFPQQEEGWRAVIRLRGTDSTRI